MKENSKKIKKMKENERKRKNKSATRIPLQVELKGAPKPLAMTFAVGKSSLGQSTRGWGSRNVRPLAPDSLHR